MSEDLTLYKAMDAFRSLAGAVAFTSNEISLFYALIDSWNVARRPDVIQQWANMTSANSGLGEKNQLPNTRNSLAQKGVIYFAKDGTRGVPHYSLNALFNLPEPPLLLKIRSKSSGKSGSKLGSKTRVNPAVKPDSYQGEEKDKKSNNTSLSEIAHEIYKAYPLKAGKAAALKAIEKALKKETRELLLSKTKDYAQARTGIDGKAVAYTKHPATFYNQECYHDDPSSWTIKESAGSRANTSAQNPNQYD